MSTGDVNVVKSVRHDPMIVKFRTSELVSELVHEGIGHFDQAYWNAQDIVNFFENANE